MGFKSMKEEYEGLKGKASEEFVLKNLSFIQRYVDVLSTENKINLTRIEQITMILAFNGQHNTGVKPKHPLAKELMKKRIEVEPTN